MPAESLQHCSQSRATTSRPLGLRAEESQQEHLPTPQASCPAGSQSGRSLFPATAPFSQLEASSKGVEPAGPPRNEGMMQPQRVELERFDFCN